MKKSVVLRICDTPLYLRVPSNWKCLGELSGTGFLSFEALGEVLAEGLVCAEYCGREYVGYLTEVVEDDFESGS